MTIPLSSFQIMEAEAQHRARLQSLRDESRLVIDQTIYESCYKVLNSDFEQRRNSSSDCVEIKTAIHFTLQRALNDLARRYARPDVVNTIDYVDKQQLFNVERFTIYDRRVENNQFVPLRYVRGVLDQSALPGAPIFQNDYGYGNFGTVISKNIDDPTSGYVYAPHGRFVGECHANWILSAVEVEYVITFPYTIHAMLVDTTLTRRKLNYANH